MNKEKIDGQTYLQMVVGGASVLGAHSGEVDDLNVFPIPDGDTGINMLQTIQGGADVTSNDEDISKEAKTVADAMLLSARGNSGVILSQFFAGVAKGLEGVENADSKSFADAFKSGVEYAYKAVVKPTEGTILTVMREATQKASEANTKTPNEFLDTFIEKNQIKHYKIIPYFIGDNLDFFRKNVYVDKSDLEYEPQKMNDIYAKKFINLNSFGRLFITATGEVYSCLYEKPTSIFKGTFKDIIMQELCSDDSPWRNIRHEEPCCNCIYQWLCPSPSSYEKAIGKPNLCHIKP